ncbi:MAG: hypothetical protein WDO19_14140 [Bacteroidota bacterium]
MNKQVNINWTTAAEKNVKVSTSKEVSMAVNGLSLSRTSQQLTGMGIRIM